MTEGGDQGHKLLDLSRGRGGPDGEFGGILGRRAGGH